MELYFTVKVRNALYFTLTNPDDLLPKSENNVYIDSNHEDDFLPKPTNDIYIDSISEEIGYLPKKDLYIYVRNTDDLLPQEKSGLYFYVRNTDDLLPQEKSGLYLDVHLRSSSSSSVSFSLSATLLAMSSCILKISFSSRSYVSDQRWRSSGTLIN